jgi:thiol-disulfide isomerase/thioredoxin
MIAKAKSIGWILIVLAGMLLSACASATPAPQASAETPVEEAMVEETEMMDDMPAGEASPTESAAEQPMETQPHSMETSMPDEEMMSMPSWYDAALTDVRSGESLKINDLKGKVVLVESMAVWCTKCLQQQRQVLELHNQLGERDDFVSLGLDIDPNEDAQTLAAYIEEMGFHWNYAVAPAEVSREIGSLYGEQFLNPTSTPMLIIDRHGEAHPLPFGIKDTAELMKALEPFLSEEM